MTGNQEYTRFRIGHFNVPTEETSLFETAADVILADAWLNLAKETGQVMDQKRGVFEAELQRWVCKITVK